MASTFLMCNAQAMYAVRSRAQYHRHAHVPDPAPLTAHEHFWICDEFIITGKTVKMISLPTAISDVFHETMSFRFNTLPLVRCKEAPDLMRRREPPCKG